MQSFISFADRFYFYKFKQGGSDNFWAGIPHYFSVKLSIIKGFIFEKLSLLIVLIEMIYWYKYERFNYIIYFYSLIYFSFKKLKISWAKELLRWTKKKNIYIIRFFVLSLLLLLLLLLLCATTRYYYSIIVKLLHYYHYYHDFHRCCIQWYYT